MGTKLIQNKMERNRAGCQRTSRGNIYAGIGNLLMVFLCALILFNQLLIVNIKTKLGIDGYFSKMVYNIIYSSTNESPAGRNLKLTGNIQKDAIEIVMIKGQPDLYGKKLNVSFDRVQESIDIMNKYDPGLNMLSKSEFARYVGVTGKISCEFCCTVKSLTYDDGKPTCNCDHAKAMRGLASYLIRNYGDKYSDGEILRELARWKGVFSATNDRKAHKRD